MLNNEIQDFSYHEFKTDSDNFVKDMAKLFSLGKYSKEILSNSGEIIKKAGVSIEYNWYITYPAANFDLLERKVNTIEELDSDEYETIVNDQISRITNEAVVKCSTIAKNKSFAAKSSTFEQSQGERAQLYLQMYMPRFLCDTEIEDPLIQTDGITIPLCVNPKTGKKEATVRNYHWCLFRLFDKPNEDFSGPSPNKTDMVTGELLEFNSASSEWAKLSWFTDFEEMFMSDIIAGTPQASDKIVRIPVNSSLTNKTKIKVMANFHPNRVAITVVGNPNVDYEDNRYLISTAYIGAIDSFKNAKSDTDGNFGIYTTSSSVPAIPNQTIEPTSTFSGLNEDENGEDLPDEKKWMIYNQTPPKNVIENSPEPGLKSFINIGQLSDLNIGAINLSTGELPGEMVFKYSYKKREVPSDPLNDSEGGRTGIVEKSLKATLGFINSKNLNFNAMFEYGNSDIGCHNNKFIYIQIPSSDLKSSMIPVSVRLETKENSLTEIVTVTIKSNDLYKMLYKYIEAELATIGDLDALTPKKYIVQRIRFSGVKYTSVNIYGGHTGPITITPHNCFIGFDEQGAIKKVVNKTKRDKYGNLVSVDYPKTFGKHTANCSTDFAMYKTDSVDFWQSHFLMFSSTEPFMKKHMYGKSAYTNEYFADKIKVTHSAEGVRGTLSGVIVIDADSLFSFDELIVNKDFKKEPDNAEETYVYVPITADYSPFANSPNERSGLGLLKELKYPELNDESKCNAALLNLSEKYIDSLFYANNKTTIPLAEVSHNELEIKWSTDSPNIIEIQTPEQKKR